MPQFAHVISGYLGYLTGPMVYRLYRNARCSIICGRKWLLKTKCQNLLNSFLLRDRVNWSLYTPGKPSITNDEDSLRVINQKTLYMVRYCVLLL